ncbi:MAG: response regulator [Desulfobacterales bacterium]|nr:response regulator [Desulfobacterales bacterium]
MKAETDQLTGKKVLIIDDDQFSVLLSELKLKQFTKRKNINSVGSVQDAVEYLGEVLTKRHAMIPDLILLETSMSDNNGWGFLTYFEEIEKSTDHPIQLVILTSSQFFSDFRRSQSHPSVTGFLMKPMKVELLNKLLNLSSNAKRINGEVLINSFVV